MIACSGVTGGAYDGPESESFRRKYARMESAELLIVGCGPAGATAAREAARAGIHAVVLEKDAVVGAKRVCAAGLRPRFCEDFDLPREIVHFDTPRLALFDAAGTEHALIFGPGHTTTREELDGTIASLAQREGAEIRTQTLFRSLECRGDRVVVEYADLRDGARKRIAANAVFFAQGSTAVLEETPLRYDRWRDGLMTTLQYRVYLERPAEPVAYETLEMHYYLGRERRQVVGWMFPKKDHLAIGLGIIGKMEGAKLRAELDALVQRIAARLYPNSPVLRVKTEGHLLYMGAPRSVLAAERVAVGGTAAGLVDATNGEGIYEAAMSGRIFAESLAAHRDAPARAARRYARAMTARFVGRLQHRLKLMHFLERKPERFGILFEQLAKTPRLPQILHGETHARTLADRAFLYAQMVRFLLKAA
jgi:geranylgeranyl diphosphate/geranylgeranyl-bacteriochlorophyllide a reductase